jgi:hypothetical protein
MQMTNSNQPLKPDPLEKGDMVYYRGRLSRIKGIEEFGEHHCWLLNDDGDTYLVPRSHPDLQCEFYRTMAESMREDFEYLWGR